MINISLLACVQLFFFSIVIFFHGDHNLSNHFLSWRFNCFVINMKFDILDENIPHFHFGVSQALRSLVSQMLWIRISIFFHIIKCSWVQRVAWLHTLFIWLRSTRKQQTIRIISLNFEIINEAVWYYVVEYYLANHSRWILSRIIPWGSFYDVDVITIVVELWTI